MKIADNITVILGPAPCHECEQIVVYGTAKVRGPSGALRRWRDPATGKLHRCKPLDDRDIMVPHARTT